MLGPFHPSRRQFLAAGASAALASLPVPAAETSATPTTAPRPQPPYRVWFQPRLYHRDLDLYRHMTVDASGWLDPRLTHALGKTTLSWVYGLNHPYADGPEYWRAECSIRGRSFPKDSPSLIAAGIAVDEWVPPGKADNPQGLRQGRADDQSSGAGRLLGRVPAAPRRDPVAVQS